MSLLENNYNRSLKSFLKIDYYPENSLKKYLDLYLFEIFDTLNKSDYLQYLHNGNFTQNDIERYTKHNLRAIINALTFDDKQFLLDAFEFVYRVYRSRKIDLELMLKIYSASINSAYRIFSIADAKAMEKIFIFLEKMHSQLILDSEKPKTSLNPEDFFYNEQKKLYELVLESKVEEATQFSFDFLQKHGLDIYTYQIMRTVMSQIGYDWEENKITYAKEHLVSSLFENILEKFLLPKNQEESKKSSILILTPPSEHHGSGAKALAKILNANGMYTTLLESQRDIQSIISQITLDNPKILAISVTLPNNLYEVNELIFEIKNHLSNINLKIAVGGQALEYLKEPSFSIGADACLHSPNEALEIFSKWLGRS
jgi:methanogenic corrinoid protein MtbC1